MWLRIFAITVKELLASIRDRQTRFVVLIAPPFLLIIYAFAITQEVRDASLGVLNRDTGREARELIASFRAASAFSRVLDFDAPSDAEAALAAAEVAMVLHVPPDYSRRVLAGEQVAIQLLIDARRSNRAQILMGYASRIVVAHGVVRAGAAGGGDAALGVVTRMWFNPNAEPLWYGVPALFAVMVAIVAFLVSALAVARERELGTFDQLLVSPLRPVEILIGKTVPAILVAAASATAMLVLSELVLDVPFRGSLFMLFGAMLIYIAANIGIGLFISSLSSTQQQAVIGLFIYMTPAVLLSGYATPVENMPDWLQWLTQANPVTHFIAISKGVFLRDVGGDFVLRHSLPMLAIAVANLTAGTWLFRRRLG